MILTGNEDLRVVKTIGSIKKAFEELICKKDYEKITVKELCDIAKINKKTFYHYYETLDALLSELKTEMSRDFTERIKGYKLPGELDKVNREFFLYSAEQGLAYEKITCSMAYTSIRDDMIASVSDAGWSQSKQFVKLGDYEKKLLIGFVNNAVLTAYKQWVDDEKRLPVEEVIEMTNKLVISGVSGFFNR